MPSVKWMEAEERIFNDPEYQRAQVTHVGWIDRLQRAQTADVLGTCVRNMQEVGVFFVRADPVAGLAGRSLRDINNAYRHGTQVVYEDCSPEEIPWRAANPERAQGMLVAADEVDGLARAEIVNVLLEGPDEEGMPASRRYLATATQTTASSSRCGISAC